MKMIGAAVLLVFTIFMAVTESHAQAGWEWGLASTRGAAYGVTMAQDKAGNIFTGDIYSVPDYITLGPDTVHSINYLSSVWSTLITKTDSAGNVLWTISTKNAAAQPARMATDPLGNLFVIGMYWDSFCTLGTITLANTTMRPWYEIFMAKISPDGNVLWARNIEPVDSTYNTFYLTEAVSLGVDGGGNAYVTGPFNYPTITIGATTLTDIDTSGQTSDIFIAKYDPNGNPIWARQFGTDSTDNPIDLVVTKRGDVYITGNYINDSIVIGGTKIYGNDTITGGLNNFLAKFDSSGNFVWAKTVDWRMETSLMTTDAYDNIYMTGSVLADTFVFGSATLYGAGDLDAIFVKYDSAGHELFGRLAGGDDEDIGYGISVDSLGNIWMCGEFGAPAYAGYTMYFDGNPLSYSWGTFSDPLFIAEYDKTGNFITAMALRSGGLMYANLETDNHGSLYLNSSICGDTLVFGPDLYTGYGYLSGGLIIAKYRYDTSACDVVSPAAAFTSTGTSTVSFTYTGTTGYDSLRWNFGDGTTSTITNPIHAFTTGGTFNVCVSIYTSCASDGVANYCSEIHAPLSVAGFPAGGGIDIYPNPASDELTITAADKIREIAISNSMGQTVYRQQCTSNRVQVDVAGITPGLYFIRINDVIVKKFVKL